MRKLTTGEWIGGCLELVGEIGGFKIGRRIAKHFGVDGVYSVLFGIALSGFTSRHLDPTIKFWLKTGKEFKKAWKEAWAEAEEKHKEEVQSEDDSTQRFKIYEGDSE